MHKRLQIGKRKITKEKNKRAANPRTEVDINIEIRTPLAPFSGCASAADISALDQRCGTARRRLERRAVTARKAQAEELKKETKISAERNDNLLHMVGRTSRIMGRLLNRFSVLEMFFFKCININNIYLIIMNYVTLDGSYLNSLNFN